MVGRYIDLDNFSHLIRQSKGGGVYDHRLWRESYYFNMNDPRSGLSLITTIGILPNRKLLTGFFLLIKDNKTILLKPIIERKPAVFKDYSFDIKGLKYSVEGANWRLSYDSRKYIFDILFTPLNRIYGYVNGEKDLIFSSIGSQHYEQFGMFEGEAIVSGKKYDIGPCYGHRDHSWGIRDWSAVDRYRLFCCVFSRDFAFNIWQGSIGGTTFLKGYVFDGEFNIDLTGCDIETIYTQNGKEPVETSICFSAENNRTFEVECRTMYSMPVPPRSSILYECISEMRWGSETGYGLQEYLYHEPNPLVRVFTFLKLLKNM